MNRQAAGQKGVSTRETEATRGSCRGLPAAWSVPSCDSGRRVAPVTCGGKGLPVPKLLPTLRYHSSDLPPLFPKYWD